MPFKPHTGFVRYSARQKILKVGAICHFLKKFLFLIQRGLKQRNGSKRIDKAQYSIIAQIIYILAIEYLGAFHKVQYYFFYRVINTVIFMAYGVSYAGVIHSIII